MTASDKYQHYLREIEAGPQIKLRVVTDLYKGPYIEHSLHVRNLHEAEWLAKLWVDASINNKKKYKVHAARLYITPPGKITRWRVRGGIKVLFFTNGNFKRKAYAHHWGTAKTFQHIWCKQSEDNSALLYMYLPSRGWIVDSVVFAEREREYARMASLAAASSKTKVK